MEVHGQVRHFPNHVHQRLCVAGLQQASHVLDGGAQGGGSDIRGKTVHGCVGAESREGGAASPAHSLTSLHILQHSVPVFNIAESPTLNIHVGILTSWDQVVKASSRCHNRHTTLKWTIHVANKCTTCVQLLEVLVVDARVTWQALPCRNKRVQRWLRRAVCPSCAETIRDVT